MVLQTYARTLYAYACALLIVFVSCCNYSVAQDMLGPQDMAALEEFFKNIDMEQLAKDMEKVFAEIEEMERKEKEEKQQQQEEQPYQPEPLSFPTQDSTPSMPATKLEPEVVVTKPQPDATPKTTSELFIDPETMTIQQGNKTQTVPTPASMLAAQEVLDKLAHYTQKIETHIQGSSLFSPDYQENFLRRFGNNVDAIGVSTQHITSKRAYQSVLLTPPTQNKQLVEQMQTMRKKIVKAVEELEQTDEKIVATAVDEADEKTLKVDDFQTLQEIKEKQAEEQVPHVQTPERTQKKRGLRSPDQLQEQTEQEQEQVEEVPLQEPDQEETPLPSKRKRALPPQQTDYFSYIMIALVILLLLGLGFVTIQKFRANKQEDNNQEDQQQNEPPLTPPLNQHKPSEPSKSNKNNDVDEKDSHDK